MKKILFALLCTVFLGGFAAAEGDNSAPAADQGQSAKPAHEGRSGKRMDPDQLLAKCPDCADLVTQIKAKLAEMKTLDDQIKQKHEAEMAKLKETDPAKYEKMKARMDEQKKKMEESKTGQGEQVQGEGGGKAPADNGGGQVPPLGHRNRGEGGPDGADREKRMEMMKKNNPELYELMVKKQALGKEIRDLFEKAKVIIDGKKESK